MMPRRHGASKQRHKTSFPEVDNDSTGDDISLDMVGTLIIRESTLCVTKTYSFGSVYKQSMKFGENYFGIFFWEYILGN